MEEIEKSKLTLDVNGKTYHIEIEDRKTLADTLREDCGLTGTHVGCEHGVCGACTVLLEGKPVRACLVFGIQAAGKAVRSVEGLAVGDNLSDLQKAFIENHSLQCGFCTPGFLMLITGALEEKPDLSDEELTDILSSNLCRCTGYRNIFRAAKAVRDQRQTGRK